MANTGQKFPDPPIRSPFFTQSGAAPATSYPGKPSGGAGAPPTPQQLAFPWVQYLQNITNQFNAKIPVSGSRSNGEALQNLLQALDKLGFIQNTSTD